MTSNLTGTVSLDKGRRALDQLLARLSKRTIEWNEAETRFQFIDPFLINCLGWPKSLIHVERAEGREYTDYELGEPRSVIWEAKREGVYFDLPANPSRKLICSLPSIMATSSKAACAIKQVQPYCSTRGVQLAVVCNGQQLIAFLAVRLDGQNPLDGQCLACDGYLQIKSEFPTLWQALSPDGVTERRLSRLLTKGPAAGIPRKLSTYVLNYHQYRYKNESETSLRTLAEFLIEDIANTVELEDQFFRECYCESGALSQYALISRSILTARYSALFSPNEPSPSIAPLKPSKNEITLTPEIMSEAFARRPFVLLGDVGVGKTSFLKYLIYESAREEFSRSVYIYIDLGSKAALSDNLHHFVINEFENQLLARYQIDIRERNFVRGVYNKEIERFRRGIYAELYEQNPDRYSEKLLAFLEGKVDDSERHLTEAIQHIVHGQSRQVILILDNSDQRNLQIQQDAFIIAQNFAQGSAAAVFIALRPQTFHQSRRSGSLSAYPQKVFSISPPRPDRVLEKRLKFALKMAEGEMPVEALPGVALHVPNISLFIKSLLYSIRNNNDLVELLDNITGGNIRTLVELIKNFIGNPNIRSDKIITIMETTGSYIIPVHEFSKSAILGEFSHFHEDSSLAMNLFDVRFPDRREHFLVLLIIAFLNHEDAHRDQEGFVTSPKVIEELQQCGFMAEQIESALRRTTNKRLIETTERITFDEDITDLFGEMPRAFRITTVGAYHLQKWGGTFQYLDAMVFETPIFDDTVMDVLMQNPGSFSIEERYARTAAFRSYLTACWHDSGIAVPYFEWIQLIKAGKDSFTSVERFIARQR